MMDWLILDWLILLVLVPAVIVPVVLLWGFVGCTSFGAEETTVDAPTNLKATAVGTSLVKLTWDQTSPATIKEFALERNLAPHPKTPIVPADPAKPPAFDDADLEEGSVFSYRVQAMAHNGTKSAFSGEAKAMTLLKAPSNFVATPKGPNQIELTWNNNSTKADRFQLERSLKPDSDYQPPVLLLPGTVMHPDTDNLSPGTTYYYRLTARGPNDTFSESAVAHAATTPPWRTSFATTLDLDGGNYYQGACLVQRINGANVAEGGTWVRITMNSNSANETKVLAVYISTANPAGEPWDSAAVPVELRFGGVSGVSLQNGVRKQSDPTKFTVVKNQDLIIAFATTANSQNLHYAAVPANVPGPRLYSRRNLAQAAAVAEAAKQDRNLNEGPDEKVICIEKIEVA